MKQTTFASAAGDKKDKATRREGFPGEMDRVVPWGPIVGLIEPSEEPSSSIRNCSTPRRR